MTEKDNKPYHGLIPCQKGALPLIPRALFINANEKCPKVRIPWKILIVLLGRSH